jgi:hypothetical protein
MREIPIISYSCLEKYTKGWVYFEEVALAWDISHTAFYGMDNGRKKHAKALTLKRGTH